jgi:hypothetical protein
MDLKPVFKNSNSSQSSLKLNETPQLKSTNKFLGTLSAKEVTLPKKKILARPFDRVNEGRVKFHTPTGWILPEQDDWIIWVSDDLSLIVPKHTMEYLLSKDESQT